MIYWFAMAINFLSVAYFSLIGNGMPSKVLYTYFEELAHKNENVVYGTFSIALNGEIIVNNLDCSNSNKSDRALRWNINLTVKWTGKDYYWVFCPQRVAVKVC